MSTGYGWPIMTDAKPFPKSAQLARGERRYRRKVASPKQWQAIQFAKVDGKSCRACPDPFEVGWIRGPLQLHHVVPRDLGGDDVPDNLVPLCPQCHDGVTRRIQLYAEPMLASLSDTEYAYAVDKLGESVWERVYGIEYQR